MRFFSLLTLCVVPGMLVAASGSVAAQSPAASSMHLVYFRDKAATPYSVEQPQAYLTARAVQRRRRQQIAVLPRDLPVDPAYVAQVQAVAGTRVWYTSRWFNAVVVAGNAATLAAVQALLCVQSTRLLSAPAAPRAVSGVPTTAAPPLSRPAAARATYGRATAQTQQLGVDAMHAAGFRGEGVHVAVLDAGFPGVNTQPAFAPLYQENRLGSTYNFVDRTPQVYQRDSHGTQVLSTLAANQPGYLVGTAPQATYHLFVTEDVSSEQPIEEINWLIAAERADSLGVDIINSSLGYSTFDAPAASYTYADLNGRTALITQAATVAARVGMLVVNSAGNEGNQPWRYLLAPADADSILSVGAVDSLGLRAALSSVGPTADGRRKPNIAAMGRAAAYLSPAGTVGQGNGTSYASPIAAGLAAGFWQANPTLTAQQVIDYLQRSASQAAAPDNLLGFGIPDFSRAYALANPGTPLPTRPGALPNGLALYPNPLRAPADLYLRLSPDLRQHPLTLEIYDGRGARVLQVALPATPATDVRLPVENLLPGLYTCRVGRAGSAPYSLRLLRW